MKKEEFIKKYNMYEITNNDNLDLLTKQNVLLLENTMKECGFIPFSSEWWHFDDSDEYEMIIETFD